MLSENKVEYNINSREIKYLASRDKTMMFLINKLDSVQLNIDSNYFSSLVRIILGQQLSKNAATAIWKRLVESQNKITPENMLKMSDSKLRALGISHAKTGYIKNLSTAINQGELQLDNIDRKSNEQVVNLLTGFKGIGRWSAEIFLIFSLSRIDVLPYRDAGLRKAVLKSYSYEYKNESEIFSLLNEIWHPYQSVASICLWSALDRQLL